MSHDPEIEREPEHLLEQPTALKPLPPILKTLERLLDNADGRGIPVTVALLAVLTVMHVVSGGFQEMTVLYDSRLEWVFHWGLIPVRVFSGELWRLVSSAFLHQNWGHLGSNLLGFLIFGRMLEPAIGTRAMLLLLLVSEVCGSLLSCFFLPDTLSIGASAMDYGLIGAYITLVLYFELFAMRLLRETSAKDAAKQAFIARLRGALILLIVFVLVDYQRPHVNVWGHLGGLLAGIGFAAIWFKKQLSKTSGIDGTMR